MSDAPQAPATDTPEPSPAPVADTPVAPSDPYESRYNDLRSEFDRRNGLIAAAQNGDPDALSELGFEMYEEPQAEPAPTGEFDPFDPDYLQAFIAEQVQNGVKEALTPFQEQQKQEQIELASAGALHSIDGFESLPQEAQDTIWDLAARVLPPRQDGQYDVQAAWDRFHGLNTALQQSWASTKPSGARVAGGQAATDVPPNEDASMADLTKWAQERMRDLSS